MQPAPELIAPQQGDLTDLKVTSDDIESFGLKLVQEDCYDLVRRAGVVIFRYQIPIYVGPYTCVCR